MAVGSWEAVRDRQGLERRGRSPARVRSACRLGTGYPFLLSTAREQQDGAIGPVCPLQRYKPATSARSGPKHRVRPPAPIAISTRAGGAAGSCDAPLTELPSSMGRLLAGVALALLAALARAQQTFRGYGTTYTWCVVACGGRGGSRGTWRRWPPSCRLVGTEVLRALRLDSPRGTPPTGTRLPLPPLPHSASAARAPPHPACPRSLPHKRLCRSRPPHPASRLPLAPLPHSASAARAPLTLHAHAR